MLIVDKDIFLRWGDMLYIYIYVCVCMCVYMYMYTYMYIALIRTWYHLFWRLGALRGTIFTVLCENLCLFIAFCSCLLHFHFKVDNWGPGVPFLRPFCRSSWSLAGATFERSGWMGISWLEPFLLLSFKIFEGTALEGKAERILWN